MRWPRKGRPRPGPKQAASADGVGARLAAVYDEHVAEVYRFVHRRCHDHSLAEDITQETFMKALRRGDPDEITIGWLLTVAGNQLVDVLRRQANYDGKLRLVGVGELVSDADDLAERLRVEAALKELSVDHRIVLTLHYVDGWSVPALADHLGRSQKSIEGLITRARRRLRVELDRPSSAIEAGGAHG